MPNDSIFETLKQIPAEANTLFDQVIEFSTNAEDVSTVFQAYLMQGRAEFGIPLDSKISLEEMEEPARSQMEKVYLNACRDVGNLLLSKGNFRDAWVYLKPADGQDAMRKALDEVVPNDDTMDELIDVALYAGVHPALGITWLLQNQGVCNAITTLEGMAAGLPQDDQQACGKILVKHIHSDLREALCNHIIEKEKDTPAAEDSILELITNRPWILQGENHHIDVSHLSSTVQFARVLVDSETLKLALDLAEYGRRLARSLQFAGEEPFTDVFPSHRLFFEAQLGQQAEEAVRFFKRRAGEVDLAEFGLAAIETYLVLLDRLERYEEALEEYARLVPNDATLSPHAPTLFDLAQKTNNANCWTRFLEIVQERNNAIDFVLGLLEQHKATQSET